MDANGTSNDGHRILSERASLVGADNGRVHHCFTRAEDMDKKILRHMFHHERECQRHSKGKAYDWYEWGKCVNTESDLPSGTATTMSVTEMIRICTNGHSFNRKKER